MGADVRLVSTRARGLYFNGERFPVPPEKQAAPRCSRDATPGRATMCS